jgi:ribosomal protein L40E
MTEGATEMSKRVNGKATCGRCGSEFPFALYRSIWGENAENRELVFNDSINILICPQCNTRNRASFSLLYVDMDRQFAVWYEPAPDPTIGQETQQYAAMFGPDNFYATAPRVSDWESFKQTILEFETGKRQAKPITAGEGKELLEGFVASLSPKEERKGGCLSLVLLSLLVVGGCWAAVALWL